MKNAAGIPSTRRQAAASVGEAEAEERVLRLREATWDVAADRLSRRLTLVCDSVLDFVVLAFAAWTVIYHVCLAFHIGAVWAAAAEALALVPSGWLAFRRGDVRLGAPRPHNRRAESRRRIISLGTAQVVAALGAAMLWALTPAPWPAVWALWLLAAALAVISIGSRPAEQVAPDPPGGPRVPAAWDSTGRAWPAAIVALTWSVGLAALSLFLVRPSPDDTQYLHLSSWVADHAEFPLRDTLFSDQAFPAIFFPPISAFEALAGTIARGAGLAVPDLVYLVVPPLATALSVLATWRLLRAWRVRMVGLALSGAMLFLLTAAENHRNLGNLFVGRIWQGKIIFLAVLVPLLFVLLIEYVERPGSRQLVLLAAAGTAGAGLSSTGVFVVPVLAAGCLAPFVLRSTRQVAVGFAATVAYPLAVGVATLGVGGRTAEVHTEADVVSGRLIHFVLGDGVFALVALAAALVGPVLIRRASAAQMTAVTAFFVGCLYAPMVPLLVFRLTDLAQVQWRWIWAVPIPALVGVVAVGVVTKFRTPALRVLTAVALCVVVAAWGTPVWSAARASLAAKPAWKRSSDEIETARRILEHSRPGDAILAPRPVTQTVLVMSGTVTAVAPRQFYTAALRGVRGAHAWKRLLLMRFAEHGLGPIEGSPHRRIEGPEVMEALRAVRVDLACVPRADPAAHRLLITAGYSPAVTSANLTCLRTRAPGSALSP